MIRSIRRLASLGLAVAALALSPGASAADSAGTFIQTRQTQVTSLLRQAPGSQRDKQVAAVLDGMIDYDELAKRSLAKHWGDLSDAQRKDFTETLKRVVQKSYEKNLKNILEYRVDYLGEEPAPEGVVVHTRASSTATKEEPIDVDYSLLHAQSDWKVFDIVTAGSSLVNNYRSQFNRVIQKDGFDALLKKMKDRLAKGQQPA
ncbi:MAG TPA: ABC transporter substrate-binding protein [Polyangiaceae bacterium]|nr:ABC transporter substrate-binding protein [Polyangiaceae bacterium]